MALTDDAAACQTAGPPDGRARRRSLRIDGCVLRAAVRGTEGAQALILAAGDCEGGNDAEEHGPQ
jgi:hypothetical protein